MLLCGTASLILPPLFPAFPLPPPLSSPSSSFCLLHTRSTRGNSIPPSPLLTARHYLPAICPIPPAPIYATRPCDRPADRGAVEFGGATARAAPNQLPQEPPVLAHRGSWRTGRPVCAGYPSGHQSVRPPRPSGRVARLGLCV